jgi:hypothetical protein
VPRAGPRAAVATCHALDRLVTHAWSSGRVPAASWRTVAASWAAVSGVVVERERSSVGVVVKVSAADKSGRRGPSVAASILARMMYIGRRPGHSHFHSTQQNTRSNPQGHAFANSESNHTMARQ